MKAIIVARVSTEEQREAGNSLPAQVERMNRYCQNRGLEILQICSFDESAYKEERKEFDQIIDFALAQKEKIALCFDKVDRLSRNIFDKRVAQLYEKALKDEIEIHFVSDGQILNSRLSAAEKFQFNISLGLSKYYSDAISDNVKRAQETKIRKGEWLSKAPFGYKNIQLENDTTDIVINEHDASIVKKVFELYASGAYSMELLCKKIKQDFNLSWPKGSLGKLLNNPFYHGTMIIKGKAYPHRYPQIISKTLFEEAHKHKGNALQKPFKYAGLPFIYRGLIRCADCGCSISPERHKGYAYYHCTQYKGKHNAKWLKEETITDQLGEFFKALQMPQDIHQQIINTLAEVHVQKIQFHNEHITKLNTEQKNLTRMMDNLYLDKLKGKIGEEQYDRFYSKFLEQKNDIRLKLNNLNEAENNYYLTAKYVLDLSAKAHDIFLRSEVEEKRQLIKLVLQNLTLNGEKLVWEPRKPFDLMLNATDCKLWRG